MTHFLNYTPEALNNYRTSVTDRPAIGQDGRAGHNGSDARRLQQRYWRRGTSRPKARNAGINRAGMLPAVCG